MGRAPAKKRRSNSPDWIASGRKLDWHVSGHRQQTKCHRVNDEPQLCTCCDRESTGLIVKDGSSAPRRWCTRPTEPATGRTAGRMISNLADESLPGSCQMSELGQNRISSLRGYVFRFAPRADIAHCSRHVCFVPTHEIAAR